VVVGVGDIVFVVVVVGDIVFVVVVGTVSVTVYVVAIRVEHLNNFKYAKSLS